jgi:hypothetical protein
LAKLVAASTLPHKMAMSSSRAALASDMAKGSVLVWLDMSRMYLMSGDLEAFLAASEASFKRTSQSFIQTPFSVGKAQQQ